MFTCFRAKETETEQFVTLLKGTLLPKDFDLCVGAREGERSDRSKGGLKLEEEQEPVGNTMVPNTLEKLSDHGASMG